jgi:hypothetical protein
VFFFNKKKPQRKISDFAHYYTNQTVGVLDMETGEISHEIACIAHINSVQHELRGERLKYVLILKDLKDITQADRQVLSKISMSFNPITGYEHALQMHGAITHYLTRMGYDCFGLIDAEAAVNAKKVKRAKA